MTMQILDTLLYEGEEYEMIDWSAPLGFDPGDYGLRPRGLNTANHRGFCGEWEIVDGALTLMRLIVNDSLDNYPPVNGREAMFGAAPPFWGYHVYHAVGIVPDFTGTMVIGRARRNSPFHIGGRSARSSFKTVLEITFENGRLTGARDVSTTTFEEYANQVDEEFSQWTEGIMAAASRYRDGHASDEGD